MKLEDRLAAYFVETSTELIGRPGQVDAVIGAAGSRQRVARILIGGGVAAAGLTVVVLVIMFGQFGSSISADGAAEPTRVVVSPYVAVPIRLIDASEDPIFTVTAESPSYWRMASLDVYQDQIWKVVVDSTATSPSLDAAPTAGGNRVTLRQDFEINDLEAIWMPAAAEPIEVTVSDDVPIRVDPQSNAVIVADDRKDSDGLRYTVVSSVAVPTPDQLRAAPLAVPDVVGSRFLSTDGVPFELGALARQLTDGLPTNYDRVIAIQNHFRSYNYRADLEPISSDTDPSVRLLADRAGSARDFASAFALMARELGIPSRVAIGFTPGKPSDTSRIDPDPDLVSFEVTNQHAHAWPEIYFEGIGWIPFEPTPGHGIPLAELHTGVPAAQG